MAGTNYPPYVLVRVKATMFLYYSGFLLFFWLLVVVMLSCWRLLNRPKGRRTEEMMVKKASETKLRDSDFPSSRLMVVLGSGGHTSELLTLLSSLPAHLVDSCCYVVADTDTTSMKRVPRPTVPLVKHIPRSREVGQSWLSTIFSTARSLIVSFKVVWSHNPQLLIVNGPGTCVPIAAWVLAWNACSLVRPRCRIIFVESFCRVQSLSMTGHMLYWLADRFLVLWPELLKKYPRAEYIGRVL